MLKNDNTKPRCWTLFLCPST